MSFSGTKGYITKPKPGVMLNPLHPLSRGLVGYWLFNEGSGSLANDISGKGNHGRLTNMSPNVQGSGWDGSKFGGGLKFDGNNDFVNVGNVLDVASTDAFSISFLMNSTVDGTNQMVIGKQLNSGTYRGWMVWRKTTNQFNFAIVSDGSNLLQVDTNDTFSAGFWYHLTFTYDGSTSFSGIHVYSNRVEIATTLLGSDTLDPADSTITTAPFNIGSRNNGNLPFNGIIGYACKHNRALSANEVNTQHCDPFCNLLQVPIRRYSVAAPPVGAIMNQFQMNNLGADLYQGAIIA